MNEFNDISNNIFFVSVFDTYSVAYSFGEEFSFVNDFDDYIIKATSQGIEFDDPFAWQHPEKDKSCLFYGVNRYFDSGFHKLQGIK